jgi:hypothetical protein
LLVLIASAGSHACRHPVIDERGALRQLLSHEGKNLVGIKDAQALFDLVLNREPVKTDTFSDYFEPWEVLHMDSDILLLEGRTLFTIPGERLFRAHLVSEEGIPRSTVSFAGGWRILVSHARAFPHPVLACSLLELSSSVRINSGEDVAKQFYAVIHDDLVLVRLEDSSGRRISNSFLAPNYIIGPAPPVRSAEEWEHALLSSNAVELLRTLVWIGGHHRDVDSDSNPFAEPKSDAQLALDVRHRPGVRARIEELKSSPNAWIREAAAAVK